METTNFFEKMASIAGALNIGNLPPAVQGMIRDTVELEQARDFETITRVKEKYFEETTACMKVERREQPGMTEMSEEEMVNRKAEKRSISLSDKYREEVSDEA